MTHRQTPRTKQPPQTEADSLPYHPPQRLLDRCPGCGCVVLRGLALPGGQIKRLDPVQFPVSGRAHDCEEALSYVRIVAQQRLVTTQEGH